MTDREKVMKELSWLILNFPVQKNPIDAADKMCNAINAYCNDALAMLKEQEPRVMTRGEIIKLNDWVWGDYKDAFNGYEYKLDYDPDCDRVEWLDGATDGMEEYGKTWRCWTSRPTPEQMRETKWEGDSDGNMDV